MYSSLRHKATHYISDTDSDEMEHIDMNMPTPSGSIDLRSSIEATDSTLLPGTSAMSQDTNKNRQLTLAKLAQVESINKPSGVTSAPVLQWSTRHC